MKYCFSVIAILQISIVYIEDIMCDCLAGYAYSASAASPEMRVMNSFRDFRMTEQFGDGERVTHTFGQAARCRKYQ